MPDAEKLTRESVPSRRLDARFRNVRGTVLVAGPDAAFELTETATVIWRLIDGVNTIEQIGALLAREYDVDQETAVEDATELIASLVEGRIVEVR